MKEYLHYIEPIENQHHEMVSLVTSWCEINSSSANPDGLRRMIEVLEDAFKSLGGKQEKIQVGDAFALSII